MHPAPPPWRLLLLPIVGGLASWRFEDDDGRLGHEAHPHRTVYYDYNYDDRARAHQAPLGAIVDAVNDLGLTLLAIHNEDNENNIAISPYGALSVLIALVEGLQGDAVYEILHAAHLSEDKSVIRIGLRDIHRHLKSYFIPHEGFLSGLILNHDNVTLRQEYEEVLKFYGYSYGPTNNSSDATAEGMIKEATTIVPVVSTIAQARDQNADISTPSSNVEETSSKTTEGTSTVTAATSPKPETSTSQPTTTSQDINTAISIDSTTEQPATNQSPTTTTVMQTTSTSEATTTTQATSSTTTTTTTVQSTTKPTTTITTTTSTTSAPQTETTASPITIPTTTEQPLTTTTTEQPLTPTITAQPLTTTTNEQPLTTTTQVTSTTSKITETTTHAPETSSQQTAAVTTSTENIRTTRKISETEMAALIQNETTIIQTTTSIDNLQTTERISSNAEVAGLLETSQFSTLPPETNIGLVPAQAFRNINAETSNFASEPPIFERPSAEFENNYESTTFGNEQVLTTIPSDETTAFNPSSSFDYSYYTDPGTQTYPDVFENPTTENDVNGNFTASRKRNVRSVVDYIIARAYDDHQPQHSYYIPEEPLTFLVYGKYREANVNFMRYDTVLPFYYIPHLDTMALSFPLDSTKYYLLLLLPADETGIDKLICDLRLNGSLRYIVKNLKFTRVVATIPSFMLKGHVTLTQTLQKLGIHKVFEPRQADFSPMTNETGIYVTNIEQAVTVTIRNYVDPAKRENFRSLYNYEPLQFKADHPFLYFVIDSELQATLMAGKVVNPLNSRIR